MKKFQAWRSVIEFSFPLILVPFLGAWSDAQKNRRKPVMLFALSGRYLFLLNSLTPLSFLAVLGSKHFFVAAFFWQNEQVTFII
jgi:hypothetical protein